MQTFMEINGMFGLSFLQSYGVNLKNSFMQFC
jgi:hypothetical protein